MRPNIGLSPSVGIDPSKRHDELEVVRKLCIGLSRKGLLFKGAELERPGEAALSAEEIIEETDAARKALPRGSGLDATFEWLQDACQELRDDVRRRGADAWPFGEELLVFRSLVLQWAELIHSESNLDEARRLALKVNLSNALHPDGVTSLVDVDPSRVPEQRAEQAARAPEFEQRPPTETAIHAAIAYKSAARSLLTKEGWAVESDNPGIRFDFRATRPGSTTLYVDVKARRHLGYAEIDRLLRSWIQWQDASSMFALCVPPGALTPDALARVKQGFPSVRLIELEL